MRARALRVLIILGLLLTGAAVTSSGTAGYLTSSDAPVYVGSTACLGCHVEYYEKWQESVHSISMQQLLSPTDYPSDPALAPPELKAELEKADFIWHDRRFLMQDPVTGNLKYLNVGYNPTTQLYEAYNGGRVWSDSCGGCHSGAVNAGVHTRLVEPGISCENCHGPGSAHILGKGDPTLIVTSTDPSKVCAQCHSGMNTIPNTTRHAAGYKPGTPIEEFAGFQPKVYEMDQAPPVKRDHHLEEYPQWKASAHAGATTLLVDHGETRERCFNCHSASTGLEPDKGAEFKADQVINDGVSCVACHTSHGSSNEYQLKVPAEQLCISCHSVGTNETKTIGIVRPPHSPQDDMLRGTGAIGVEPTKGAHTGVTCVECHMTESNHMMRVIKPADVAGTERKDSCTACHTNSSAEVRGIYLNLWQETVAMRMANLKVKVDDIDALLKADANALGERLAAYQNARANYWMVMKDHSNGAHNFDYTLKILASSEKEIGLIRALMP